MTPWIWIVAGLITLIVGAELLVRGSAWIAEALGIRPLIVGLTVVAVGTSAPELVVSIIAAGNDSVELVVGNIFGSNTANIALILGATALVRAIDASGSRLRFEMVWLLGASTLCFAAFLGGAFSRQLGVAMVVMLGVFVALLVLREVRGRPERQTEDTTPRTLPAAALHVCMVGVGVAGLIYGGDWLVSGALDVAKELGLGEGAVGATIVALGTSLPELATSVVAARRGHPELAVGNVIGSNIFNILLVLGITAIIAPISVVWHPDGIRILLPLFLTVFAAILLLRFRRISRWNGGVLLTVYFAYIVWEVS